MVLVQEQWPQTVLLVTVFGGSELRDTVVSNPFFSGRQMEGLTGSGGVGK